MRTATAGQKSPEREIDMDVGTHRRERLTSQAVLISLKCLKRDQAIMIAFPQGYTPHLAFDISGIERVCQDAVGLLVGHMTMARARELRMQFEKAFHFRL
jgi:hypothetical protein